MSHAEFGHMLSIVTCGVSSHVECHMRSVTCEVSSNAVCHMRSGGRTNLILGWYLHKSTRVSTPDSEMYIARVMSVTDRGMEVGVI